MQPQNERKSRDQGGKNLEIKGGRDAKTEISEKLETG